MTQQYDDDGGSIILSEDDRELIQAEIREQDVRLAKADFLAPMALDLRRPRMHLVDELASGRRLPLPDDSGEARYRITVRAVDLGGSWNPKLFQADGVEVGGGVFPVVADTTAAVIWWKTLGELERARWMRRVESTPNVEAAHLAHLADEAYLNAQMAGDDWLHGR